MAIKQNRTLDFGGHARITNLPEPAGSHEPATRGFAESLVEGPGNFKVVLIKANYTVKSIDAGSLLLIDATLAPITITLPNADTVIGPFNIRAVTKNENLVTLTVTPASGQLIDEEESIFLGKTGEDLSATVASDGANYHTF